MYGKNYFKVVVESKVLYRKTPVDK